MCFSYVCSIGACLALSVSSSFLWLGLAGAFIRAVVVPCGGRKKSVHTSSYSLAPDPYFIFLFFLFLLFFFFFFFFFLSIVGLKRIMIKINNVEKERIRHKTKTTGASLIIIVQVIFYFL